MVKFSSKSQYNINHCLTKIVRHYFIHKSSQKEILKKKKKYFYEEETEMEGVRCEKQEEENLEI